ncbi:ATP-binding protein [Kribbella lupini]|uniref:LuxR family transcriptional regulator n=1 Tax=Kribbella lupini TaxID=291602 RepID=A0ABN2B5Q0_9ACTN
MGTLPAELTSFVGRRRELTDARALLATGRLLTLTGVGGVGKTRLALRLAAQVRRTFPDGVWFVELASVEEPQLVPRVVNASFGLRDTDDPAAELARFLQDRSLLLVLDNCEHLVTACAQLVGLLLRAAPGIRVLATSRQVLGVEGEHLYAVPPMPVDDQAEDVVRLFADRAVAVAPDFRVDDGNGPQIVEICRRLDGIPLAVELAAAWLRVLTLDGLLSRLDDRFVLLNRGRTTKASRQQTLEATVAWSYELCSPEEQELWARLSVFAGGFDLAAAEAVSDRPDDVLELLAGLVDKSVVQSEGGTRFHLLETLRQYGSSKLESDAVRRLHRDHYLGRAEQWSSDWRHGTDQVEAYLRTKAEHANLRSALEFSLSTPGEYRAGLRLAVALHYYWLFCGHAAEGRRWLEQALELNPEPSRDRAKALGITSYALSLLGYASTTYSYAREAEAWARENDDRDILAHTVFLLGSYYFLTGEVEKSVPMFRAALADLTSVIGPSSSFVRQLHSALAQAEIWRGRPEEGLAIAARGLELCDESGEKFARSALLFATALSEWMLGRYDAAAAHLTEGIRLAQCFNDIAGAVTWMELLCWTTAASGRFERAAELLGVTQKLWPAVGGRSMLGSLLMTDAHETCERDVLVALGPDRYAAARARGAAASSEFDHAITYALGRVASPQPAAVPDRGPLSAREYQVAELVAEGLSNKDIALRLVISRRTAESHVVHILDKLGFKSRSQIASWLTALRGV